jgi:hypothetical protein
MMDGFSSIKLSLYAPYKFNFLLLEPSIVNLASYRNCHQVLIYYINRVSALFGNKKFRTTIIFLECRSDITGTEPAQNGVGHFFTVENRSSPYTVGVIDSVSIP